MSGFDEREKGFEAKYHLDEETKFRTRARRNMLLGLWAAEKLGLTGDAAHAYGKEVVAADLVRPGGGDVVEKVVTDLRNKGQAVEAKDIVKQLAAFEKIAHDQVVSDKK